MAPVHQKAVAVETIDKAADFIASWASDVMQECAARLLVNLRHASLAGAELLEAVKEYRAAYGNCGSPRQQMAANRLDMAVATFRGDAQ